MTWPSSLNVETSLALLWLPISAIGSISPSFFQGYMYHKSFIKKVQGTTYARILTTMEVDCSVPRRRQMCWGRREWWQTNKTIAFWLFSESEIALSSRKPKSQNSSWTFSLNASLVPFFSSTALQRELFINSKNSHQLTK